MGAMWVKRFNEEGLAGSEDRPRPGWKQLRSLALKGRRFETLDELTETLADPASQIRSTGRRLITVA